MWVPSRTPGRSGASPMPVKPTSTESQAMHILPSVSLTMESTEEQAEDFALLEDFVDPSNFNKPDVHVEALLERLCSSITDKPPAEGRDVDKLAAMVGAVDRLLKQLDRADKELHTLQATQARQLDEVKGTALENEEQLQSQVGPLEQGLVTIQQKFRQLHEHMTNVVKGAASFGERLQTADRVKAHALEAVHIVSAMQAFSTADSFADLPKEFTEESQLKTAAAMSRKLLQVGQELVVSADALGGAARGAGAQQKQAPKGTIEYAVRRLEDYHNELENRIVRRFDAAVADHDLEAMADCTRIMSEFPRGEDIMLQRYISTRPMFMNTANVVFGQAPTNAEHIKDALYELYALYGDMEVDVRDELLIMEQVFPNPYRALAHLVQRMFEQRVQMTLDRLLVIPTGAGSAGVNDEELGLYLGFLVEAYRRTKALCETLETQLGGACNVMELADGVFAKHLSNYLEYELRWLETKAKKEAGTMRTISSPLVEHLLNWNAEAVDRTSTLSSDASKALNARMLFHASTAQRATSGCLLEQVAYHVVSGWAYVLERALRRFSSPWGLPNLSEGQQLLSAVNQSAARLAAETVGIVMDAIKESTLIVEAVNKHYQQMLIPAIRHDSKELGAAASGLATFTKAIEDRVTQAISQTLTSLFELIDRTLTNEQRKADFCPIGHTFLDRQTDACMLVTTLLRNVLKLTSSALQGPNAASVNAEMGRRLLALLKQHMQRFTFSSRGALRWRRDLTEYKEWLDAARVRELDDKMEELQGIASLLIVPPDSLLSLVDSVLRMGHQQALKYIRLREDFKTARVDGKTLDMIFAYD